MILTLQILSSVSLSISIFVGPIMNPLLQHSIQHFCRGKLSPDQGKYWSCSRRCGIHGQLADPYYIVDNQGFIQIKQSLDLYPHLSQHSMATRYTHKLWDNRIQRVGFFCWYLDRINDGLSTHYHGNRRLDINFICASCRKRIYLLRGSVLREHIWHCIKHCETIDEEHNQKTCYECRVFLQLWKAWELLSSNDRIVVFFWAFCFPCLTSVYELERKEGLLQIGWDRWDK